MNHLNLCRGRRIMVVAAVALTIYSLANMRRIGRNMPALELTTENRLNLTQDEGRAVEQRGETINTTTVVIPGEGAAGLANSTQDAAKAQIDPAPAASSNPCLKMNTQHWLAGPRYTYTDDNADDESVLDLATIYATAWDDKHTESSCLSMPLLLNQSICPEHSRLRSQPGLSRSTVARDSIDEHVFIWKIRLIYYAIHYHQHRHAIPEAILRGEASAPTTASEIGYQHSCTEERKQHNVGRFDFQCPHARFLVSELPGHAGLGSIMRIDAVNILLAGLASNRTVIFVNNITLPDKTVSYSPWALSSCERKDFHCVFRPMTSCVLTHQHLAQAPIVASKLLLGFLSDSRHTTARVVRLRLDREHLPVFQQVPTFLRDTAHEILNKFVSSSDERLPLLRKAADAILNDVGDIEGYDYVGSESAIKHASLLYILRPRAAHLQQIEKELANDMPADWSVGKHGRQPAENPDHNPRPQILGLPIRGSDKCRKESECLIFPNYMKLLGQLWEQHSQDTSTQNVQSKSKPRADIILTSESVAVFLHKDRFATDNMLLKRLPFIPNFISNSNDIRQGTGSVGANVRSGVSFDKILLSSLSALQLQMYAETTTIGNCCSNFHNIVFDLLRAGCGVAADGDGHRNRGKCLQKTASPEFRLCCRQAPECVEGRDKELSRYLNVSSITLQDLQKW